MISIIDFFVVFPQSRYKYYGVAERAAAAHPNHHQHLLERIELDVVQRLHHAHQSNELRAHVAHHKPEPAANGHRHAPAARSADGQELESAVAAVDENAGQLVRRHPADDHSANDGRAPVQGVQHAATSETGHIRPNAAAQRSSCGGAGPAAAALGRRQQSRRDCRRQGNVPLEVAADEQHAAAAGDARRAVCRAQVSAAKVRFGAVPRS